jgi:adenylate cyclase
MFLSRKHRPLHALFLAALGALLAMALDGSPLWQRLEGISYDWRVQYLGGDAAPDNIAVILVDDASLQYMEPLVGRWPWPRSVFADLIDFLELGAPQAVIFDLLFVEKQLTANGPANDARLMEATRDAANVYHAMQFMADTEDEVNKAATHQPLPPALRRRFALTAAGDDNGPLFTPRYNNYLIPIPGLYEAAAGLGLVAVDPDTDGILRRSRLVSSYGGELFPALSLAPLLQNAGKSGVRLENGAIVHGHRTVPLAADGSYLVNMYRHINTYSASGALASIAALRAGDVERMMVDPEEFAGKYVFIGASAIGLHDLKTTALGVQVPGVNLHASILGNLLQDDFLQPPDKTDTWLGIFVLSLLTSLGILLSRRLWLQLLLPFGLGAAYLGWILWLFRQHQVWEVMAPLAALALCTVFAHSFLLFTEGREKTKIRKMFSQYVSPAALAVMVDQYEEYAAVGAGSKETVSILFSDIRGFTRLSEDIAPEEIVQMLNHYFAAMTEAIHTHRGTIDKFIGDAIMAVWGAPIKSPQHAADTVRAALEMLAKLAEINAWLAQRGFAPIEMGIGINSGEVVMGSIGSEQKADYTVIGDNVNLASRLEGLTKTYGCPVLISETTYAALDDGIPCRLVDLVRVKGRHHPIKIYSPLVMDDADPARARRIAARSLTAFDAYLARDWDTALAALNDLPDDPLSQLLLRRCREYQQHDPGPEWDGVHTMKTK